MEFSDYIVYVDESGDHGLVSINPQNPVLVLTFCIFEKEAYRTTMVPLVQALKFEFWVITASFCIAARSESRLVTFLSCSIRLSETALWQR